MSTPTPTTPEHTLRKPTSSLTRSFTMPSKLAGGAKTSHMPPEIGAREGVETLYVHPNVKVVKFSAGSTSRPSTASPNLSSPDGLQVQGALPWASSSEQNVAVGPLEIYRIPGSVSFLYSGSLLHAIMPRSQCWCVDGVSKFAMRVLPNTYYRIELPGDRPEDLEKVEKLKSTFQKVLHYERTACPFARTFTVELPEEPQLKKRRRKSHGPAKRWRLEKAYSWKPEDGGEPPVEEEEHDDEEEAQDDDEADEDDGDEDDDDDSGSMTASDEDESTLVKDPQAEDVELVNKAQKMGIFAPSRPTVRDRVRDFSARRSFTAPVQTLSQSTPPRRLRASAAADILLEEPEIEASSDFPQQTHAELRSFQAIPTDMPPSPPDSSASFEVVNSSPQVDLSHPKPSVESETLLFPSDHVTTESDAAQLDDLAETTSKTGESNRGPRGSEAEQACAPHTPSPGKKARTVTANGEPTANSDPASSAAITPNYPASIDVADPQEARTHDSDPFAQIQARIQARRSIGGANSSPLGSPFKSLNSRSSTISLNANRTTISHQNAQQQHALTSALVGKACAVFLGPPAHLVKIMLRIAARFANGTFARSFLYETPAGESKRVPGSFDLDGSDIEDFDLDLDVEEDDFGVPLQSPVRLAAKAGTTSRALGNLSDAQFRARLISKEDD